MKQCVPVPGVRSLQGLIWVEVALIASTPHTQLDPHPQCPPGGSDPVADAPARVAAAVTAEVAGHIVVERVASDGSPHPLVALGATRGSTNAAEVAALGSSLAMDADGSAPVGADPVPTGAAHTQAPLVASSPGAPAVHPAPVSSGSQVVAAVRRKSWPTVASPMCRVIVIGT